MEWTRLRSVCAHRDGTALCDIADEVDRLFGFGITVVCVGAINDLCIDTRFPTWEKAYDYARELYGAAQAGGEAYHQALRR